MSRLSQNVLRCRFVYQVDLVICHTIYDFVVNLDLIYLTAYVVGTRRLKEHCQLIKQ